MPRRLVLGQDVVFNERITTEASGQNSQVLFVDELTLSVGPNANMVIDQFVYDPNAGPANWPPASAAAYFALLAARSANKRMP